VSQPASPVLARTCVVLYEPQDPVNIAATVRAMKNMGVWDLRLVRPCAYDPYNLEGIAHGTMDVIQRIRHFDDYESAVAGCVFTMGFTGRRRAARWQFLDPKGAARETVARSAEGEVAYVFGREDDGLPNAVMDRVHAYVTVPTTEHASLNLAQAVLIAMYELHLAVGDATIEIGAPRKGAPPPTNEQVEQYFTDLQRALDSIEFFKIRSVRAIMRTLRSVTFRANPDARELSLMRATWLEVINYLQRTGRPLPPPGAIGAANPED
jgi:tRNA/rRNA methyltransferase/tRNA (cytidine32/uridine32-2'-O)-methyltransferase